MFHDKWGGHQIISPTHPNIFESSQSLAPQDFDQPPFSLTS